MTTIGNLTRQTTAAAVSNQDINLNITCYQEDGTTLRTMTGATYLLTWSAKSTDGLSEITKTSAAGEITLGSPDANSVQVTILNTDIATGGKTYRWKLYGTDADGDNEFAAAVGEWMIDEWPS